MTVITVCSPGRRSTLMSKRDIVGVAKRHRPVLGSMHAGMLRDGGFVVVRKAKIQERQGETGPFHWARQIVEGNRRNGRFYLIGIDEGHASGHGGPVPWEELRRRLR